MDNVKLNLVEENNIHKVDIENYDRVIYISHPYSGTKINEDEVAEIINKLREMYPTYLFISPIHSFSYAYTDTAYQTGLDWCLYLLETCCTECWVFGDYKSSKGVQSEIAYCDKFGIPWYPIWTNEMNAFLNADNKNIKNVLDTSLDKSYYKIKVEYND